MHRIAHCPSAGKRPKTFAGVGLKTAIIEWKAYIGVREFHSPSPSEAAVNMASLLRLYFPLTSTMGFHETHITGKLLQH